MHPKARYVFTASLDVDPDKEDLFNELYDAEHVPFLLKVPGVLCGNPRDDRAGCLDEDRRKREGTRRRRRAKIQRHLRTGKC